MVLELVAVCGLYATGGAVAGMLGTAGVFYLCKSDADKLKEMELEYLKKVQEIEAQKKVARDQGEKFRLEDNNLELELFNATYELEIQEMKTRAAKKIHEKMILDEKINKYNNLE